MNFICKHYKAVKWFCKIRGDHIKQCKVVIDIRKQRLLPIVSDFVKIDDKEYRIIALYAGRNNPHVLLTVERM